MTAVERERTLRDATRRYLRGAIDYDELTRIRRATDVDYLGALTALVRAQRVARLAEARERRRWWRWWR